MRSIRTFIAYSTTSLALVWLAICFATVANSHKKSSVARSDSEAIADLEKRISNLQSPTLFMVVDRQYKPIFKVDSTDNWNSASVFSSAGQDVAIMLADADGGYFLVRSDDGSTKARLGIDKVWAGLRISERGTQTVTEKGVTHDVIRDLARIELGGQEGGNYSLKFPAFVGLLAGIGESKAGSGALTIGDSNGNKRVSMFVGEDGKGL